MRMALASSSVKIFTAPKSRPFSNIERLFSGPPRPSRLVMPRHPSAASIVAFSRRRHQNSAISSSSSKKKKKKSSLEDVKQEEDDIDEDAFEALFSMLEEDLKNDGSSIDDDDDDDEISEADFDKLQRALEEALGVGDDDDDDVEILGSAGDNVEDGNPIEEEKEEDDDDEQEEEEEGPLKLKNWQLRRLARALKNGRRKTSIKSLAAELCLDRAIVLELLRDPPPNLVMMSAALPDEPAPTSSLPESKPIEIIAAESVTVDEVKSKSEKEVPVHVLRHRWSAQKRLKKVHVATLERVYRRTKRPTNAMISSIVQVTNLPRKRVVKWFEDKRNEDGIPDHRVPYQRPTHNKEIEGHGRQHTIRRLKGMATLQRAKVYRRQGSSGPVWDEKYLLVEDKVEYRELRPCRSSLNIRNVDCSGSIAAAPPISCPRSLSTPATNQTFSGGSGKGFGIPKSKSGKRKLFLAMLSK